MKIFILFLLFDIYLNTQDLNNLVYLSLYTKELETNCTTLLHLFIKLTCVPPACNVTVAGLFEHFLFPHGQAGGKDVTTKRHTLSWRLAHRPWWQANQGQVIIVAVGVVVRVQDDLINAILLFILLRNKGVVVPQSDFILLGAVSIPVEIKKVLISHFTLPPKT